jgi:hypothetical protein
VFYLDLAPVVVVVVLAVQMVLLVMVLMTPAVLVVCMVVVVAAGILTLARQTLAALVQFVSFGPALHASFQAQAREICDEFVYSFKKWATI